MHLDRTLYNTDFKILSAKHEESHASGKGMDCKNATLLQRITMLKDDLDQMALEKTSSQMHLRKCNDLLGEIVEFPS
jgi:hypothetical protein